MPSPRLGTGGGARDSRTTWCGRRRRAGADREQQLGRGGNERDDAPRGGGDDDRVARIVHDAMGRRCGGGRQAGCSRSRPRARRSERPGMPEMKTAHPRGRRRRCTTAKERSTTPPTLPRGYSWWRERRGLLASGLRSPSRFQWRRERRIGPLERPCPSQWRGRAGIAPASERPRSRTSIVSAAQVYWGPPARRKSALQLGLEARALRRVPAPLVGGVSGSRPAYRASSTARHRAALGAGARTPGDEGGG